VLKELGRRIAAAAREASSQEETVVHFFGAVYLV